MLQKIYCLVLVAISFYGQSQNLDPIESEIEYNDEFTKSWKVAVSPEASEIKKAFKSFVKDRYDVKMKGIGIFGSKDVINAKDAFITTISSKRINLHVSVLDIDGLSELQIFGSYGSYEFFNKDKLKEEFNGLRTVLVNFIQSYLPEYYGERISNSRDKYDDLLSNSTSLEKNILKNQKKIEELKREIEELQRDLEKNKLEVEQSKINLDKTQVQFNDIKGKLSKVKSINLSPIIEKSK